MKSIVLLLCLFMGTVSAEELVCHQYGYTDNPEHFHLIKSHPQETHFRVGASTLTVEDHEYSVIDPKVVDLDGLARTFYYPKKSRVLYLYTAENQSPEIGISRIQPNSDAVFMDKALYSECEAMTQASNP